MTLMTACVSLHAQNFSWAKQGGLWAYDYGFGITTDNAGRVYLAGKYEKNANFSGTILPCEGNHDIYLAQYSPSGNLNWIRTAGGHTGDYATCVTTDGSSYVYMGGEIQGTNAKIKFSHSSITLTCKGSNDIVIAKYTLDGDLVWARSAGWTKYDKALGITLDKSGNIYVCGMFTDYAKFGNGAATVSGTGREIFVAKYDVNGNFKWVRKAGGPGTDFAQSVKCDSEGNVYICGSYENGCKFGSTTFSSYSNFYNAFVAKYSPEGDLKWVKSGGGKWDDQAWSLDIDNANRVFVAGNFNGDALFNDTRISTSGSQDIFVAEYDVLGNLKWIKRAGGDVIDRAKGIACAGDRLYITGQFGLTAQFGSFTKTAADSSDIFVACLDKSGIFKWVQAAGGKPDAYENLGYEAGNAICAEANGNVYATGGMLNGATFGSTTLKGWTRTDVFLVKYTSGSPMIVVTPEEGEDGDGGGMRTAADTMPEALADESSRAADAGPAAAKMLPDAITTQSPQFTSMNDQLDPMRIYPNPGNGSFIIDLNVQSESKLEMFIFNSAGQLVERRQLTGISQVSVDLTSKEKGIYLVEVTDGKTLLRKKVILE